jgi:hypothetical protein
MNQLKIRYWTREPKLVCHKCGRNYARTFNNNKEIWKSLRTAHFSVAKVRLAEFLREPICQMIPRKGGLPSTQAHYLSEELASNHRLQILVRNRLDNIPRFVEHPEFPRVHGRRVAVHSSLA